MNTSKELSYPKLTHYMCKDADCRLCLMEHLYLGEFLKNRIGSNSQDWLGKIHWFVGNNDWCIRNLIVQETEYGWADPDQFKPKLLDMFIEWAKDGYDRSTAKEYKPKE